MSIKRRLLSCFIVLCLIVSTSLTQPVSFAATFSDVDGHWAKPYIDILQPAGIINGYADGTFKPEKPITRMEFIKIVVSVVGGTLRAPASGEYWGMPYVEYALSQKIITESEYGGLTIDALNQNINREEMSGIVVGALGLKGISASTNDMETAKSTLTDFDTGSSEYYLKSLSAVALGIITGFSEDQTFRPQSNATRAQATTVVHRMMTKLDYTVDLSLKVAGIKLGDSYETVVKLHGAAIRQDNSEYGFKWHVYHKNYQNYFMIGIQNNTVVALFTASNLITTPTGLKIGLTKAQVTSALGQPLTSIKKDSTFFNQPDAADFGVYLKDGAYISAYFDTIDNQLFMIKVVSKPVEENYKLQYGTYTPELRTAYETEVFDLANVFRVQRQLPVFKWDEKVSATARKHSQDMAVRNFFDHVNPSGYDPFERLAADGIAFHSAGENIAAGYTNPFSVHAGWVNSVGHRNNLIRTYSNLGVGVYFGGSYALYYTQNFITP